MATFLIILGVVAIVSATLAGLFGGLYLQSRRTAEVWETAYGHVREQVAPPMTVVRQDAQLPDPSKASQGRSLVTTPIRSSPFSATDDN